MQISVERVKAILKMAQQPISMQATVVTATTPVLAISSRTSRRKPLGHDQLQPVEGQAGDVLGTLTERERRIVELRFGLVDGYARTLEEVGKQYKVTRERIRQIEAKALRQTPPPTRVRHLKGFLGNGKRRPDFSARFHARFQTGTGLFIS